MLTISAPARHNESMQKLGETKCLRRRYWPAGNDEGITTECLPNNKDEQPSRVILTTGIRTAVGIDDVGRPLL